MDHVYKIRLTKDLHATVIGGHNNITIKFDNATITENIIAK